MAQPDEIGAPRAEPAGRVFHFRCLRCGSVLQGRSSQCGRKGKCPTCGAVFTVPQMDPTTGLAVSHADPGDDGENPTPLHAYASAGGKAPRILRKDDDSLVIECPRCKCRSAICADNCSSCGLPFTLQGADGSVATAAGSRAPAALALGLVALPTSLCAGMGAIPGLFAILLGYRALASVDREPKGRAVAAIVLGALACVISAVILLSFW